MQGPADATAPGLAAAPPFRLEAPCLGQQTAGIICCPSTAPRRCWFLPEVPSTDEHG